MCVILVALSCAHAKDDTVVLSFATVGDSRYDAEAAHNPAADARWHQNTRALARIVREIAAQNPTALFFNGDMIYGYTTNRAALDPEYAYWRGMMATLIESGTCVIPVPGNHEVQLKLKSPEGTPLKRAFAANEDAWRENMGDLILDTDAWHRLHHARPTAWSLDHTPAIGGPDGISTDQRQLPFSFDFHGAHFAVINTDPVGRDGRAPTEWLRTDLAAARKRGASHCFVFGHKQAFTYAWRAGLEPKGLDAFPDDAKAFWDVIEANDATYFCGHEHVFHASQPRGRAWQIISGSGGSPFEAKAQLGGTTRDRHYAWAFVTVHRNGEGRLEARGFDENYGPTHVLERITLHSAHGKPLKTARVR